MMRISFILLMAALSLPNCKHDPEKELSKLESEMGGAMVVDRNKANQYIQVAEKYAADIKSTNPDKYAELILKTAGLAHTIENAPKALELYHQLADQMPQHPKAPQALFMIGFVHENLEGDLPKAKLAYETFLQRYPDDPDFSDDAETALKLLGKSPEEIIETFKARADSITQ